MNTTAATAAFLEEIWIPRAPRNSPFFRYFSIRTWRYYQTTFRAHKWIFKILLEERGYRLQLSSNPLSRTGIYHHCAFSFSTRKSFTLLITIARCAFLVVSPIEWFLCVRIYITNSRPSLFTIETNRRGFRYKCTRLLRFLKSVDRVDLVESSKI